MIVLILWIEIHAPNKTTGKKISLCRLITVKRKLILLDEPYSSLDKAAISILNNLIKERSKFYSLSSHRINCDKLDKAEIINKILDIYEYK